MQIHPYESYLTIKFSFSYFRIGSQAPEFKFGLVGHQDCSSSLSFTCFEQEITFLINDKKYPNPKKYFVSVFPSGFIFRKVSVNIPNAV